MRCGNQLVNIESSHLPEGAACSEVFTGPRLAKVLRPAFDCQKRVIEQLETDAPFEPLGIHTSAGGPVGRMTHRTQHKVVKLCTISFITGSGFPPAVTDFVEILEVHLPWPTEDDWFLNLQLEGASAVWAGVEALAALRAQNLVPAISRCELQNKDPCYLGVAEQSYHGARTTGLGQPALPRWTNAPRTDGQIPYPLPPAEAATSESAKKAYLKEFEGFLAENTERIGIFIFEPQWGSSLLGRTWPKDLLQKVIELCHRFEKSVLCDEIMCGLGRRTSCLQNLGVNFVF